MSFTSLLTFEAPPTSFTCKPKINNKNLILVFKISETLPGIKMDAIGVPFKSLLISVASPTSFTCKPKMNNENIILVSNILEILPDIQMPVNDVAPK